MQASESATLSPVGRRVVSWFLYLTVVGGSASAAMSGFDRGHHSIAVFLVVFSVAALITLFLEHLFPLQKDWLQSHGDLVTDILHASLSNGSAQAGRAMIVLLLARVGVVGPPVGILWPTSWPLPLQLFLALVLVEPCGYFLHRAQHRFGLLWRFHAIHHTAPRLYWLNSMRNHPLDSLPYALILLPLTLLGAPERLITIFSTTFAVQLLLQHANIDFRLGRFMGIIHLAETHKWHHSQRLDEADCNFGNASLVCDLLFGTRRLPVPGSSPRALGLAESGDHPPDYPQDYLGQIKTPFDRTPTL
jgi:sterol desaturase/sphingolipid hydroxylase (fatty acid hydroxylase superfamily)